MVVKEYRGGIAVAHLIRECLWRSNRDDNDLGLFGGGVGRFARFYRTFGATVVDATPHNYWAYGHDFGPAYLMCFDLPVIQLSLEAKLERMISGTLCRG